MIKKFKTYNEDFSFDKIESEEIVIDINDYAEEYDNIFKDRYRCVKAVGPIHQEGEIFNVKDLFKDTFGMWITSKSRYAGDETEKLKIIKGFDCDIEFLQLKKGNYIMIWPGKQKRINDADPNYEPYPGAKKKVKIKGSRDNFSVRFAKRWSEHEKIFIPANRVVMYNLVEYLRDAQEKLIGGYFWETSSGTIVRGTTDKRYTGKEEEIVITRPRYIYTNGDHLILKSQKIGGTVWDREKETYLDITKPIYGKMVHWIDPELDPYGEEEWEDEVREQLSFDDDDTTRYSSEEYTPPKPQLVLDKTLNFSDFLRFDLLGLKKLNLVRDFMLEQIAIIKQGHNNARTKGRVFNIKSVKIDGDQYYEIKMMTKQGEKSIIIGDGDKFKVKTPKQIKTKFDPYGEEDWELLEDEPVMAKKKKNKVAKDILNRFMYEKSTH